MQKYEADDIATSTAVRTLWSLYRVSSPAQRVLAALRPYICPVNPILSSVPIGAVVLDIGCGNGLALSLMARFRNIKRGVGVEINPTALIAARAVSAVALLPLTYAESTGFDDWPSEMFDAVTMIDVLHHVPQGIRQEFITHALGHVFPGGRFIYKDMTSNPWWRVSWNIFHDLLLARQLVHVEPMNNVIDWARQVGFYPKYVRSYVAFGLYGHDLIVFERQPFA